MSQVNATGNLVQNNINTRIGLYEAAAFSTQFLGYINEVRIWNVSKTQSEIKANMNSPLTNPIMQAGLVAYYAFNNLNNKQGNATYNGTLSGAAAINTTTTDCKLVVDTCFFVTPVSLTTFSANSIDNKKIRLNWHTEEESNIVKYTIERSAGSGNNFESIGNVSARNNLKSNDCDFTDDNLQTNLIYHYRLLISENNGTQKYSPVRTAKISGTDSHISVYPNPNNGLFRLKIQNITRITSIRLLNTVGQLVFSKTINASTGVETTIDIHSQPKGNYYLFLQTDKDKIIQKIIKL